MESKLFAFTYEVFNDITVQLWRGPEHSDIL